MGRLLIVLVLVVLTGCTHRPQSPPTPAPTQPATTRAGAGVASQGYREARVSSATTEVSLSVPSINDEIAARLDDLLAVGAIVTAPVEIKSDASAPGFKVTLTRTYAAPLPKGVSATFVYFDDQLSGWRTVDSKLSKDRRTLTAKVKHLSVWTDVLTWSSATAYPGRAGTRGRRCNRD